ncbi:aminopeptidase [Weissella viridescens]|uniref:PepS aminopeptidase n=2 Tax=Weissella TaxID=46255 RepID=A0A0R2H3D4_WEIVI|nr:aminopeptidase [Weissella viridescens]KRN47112.1 PepS aminopeptidase [Weissella viridescens]GEA94669.1 aminopeptidase [Weissella viridescens]
MTLEHFDLLLDKYAHLVTSIGVNVRKGQSILIYAEIEQAPFVHKLTDAAYERGATRVDVEWSDLHTKRAFLENAPEEALATVPTWVPVRSQNIADANTTRISILSADPDGYSHIDDNRISTLEQAMQRANSPVRQATMNNDLDWIVIGAAGQAWAQKVFPDLEAPYAQDQLWAEIFKVSRISVDNDPEADWAAHVAKLKTKSQWLNQQNFKSLHFKSPITDINIGLAENHFWEAADSADKSGHTFIANMPTEEVFTSPDYRHIDGHVQSTKPLSYAGTLIKDIQLTFKDGHVTEAHASTGEAILKQLIATDAGASSLGEVSLVPDPSPISQSGITFYNTLFDENASDHLALGAAYPSNIQGGTQMPLEERQAHGQNESLVHVDFMIGSADMDVDGITFDGKTVPVFRNGDWA